MGDSTPAQRLKLQKLGVGGNLKALTWAAADRLIRDNAPDDDHDETLESAVAPRDPINGGTIAPPEPPRGILDEEFAEFETHDDVRSNGGTTEPSEPESSQPPLDATNGSSTVPPAEAIPLQPEPLNGQDNSTGSETNSPPPTPDPEPAHSNGHETPEPESVVVDQDPDGPPEWDEAPRNNEPSLEPTSPTEPPRANDNAASIIPPEMDDKITIFNWREEAGGEETHAKPSATGAAKNKEPIHNWHDPDLSLLDDRRGELPEFPLNTLAPSCRQWVERASHGAGVTPAHVIVPLLGISSSIIGTARRVQATSAFTQPMTVWGAIVGLSGSGKTPGIEVIKKALNIIVKNRGPKIDDTRRKHETLLEAAKAAQKKWKKEFDEAIKSGQAPPTKPAAADDVGEFVVPHLYVSDATIERLGVLLTARPQGLLLLLDELAGLFSNMRRYTSGTDNQFWLEAWNGGAHSVDRMNRPSLRIPHLLIGVVGGLQPDKLADSFAGAADGMYARFLFSWPSESTYRPLSDTRAWVDPEIINALDRFAALGGDEPRDFAPKYVPLSPQALSAFEEFRKFVSDGKSALDGRERDWWAKMPGQALRLAGTLAYLVWGMTTSGDEPTEITIEFTRAAITLMREYFFPHARAALRQIGLSERDADARRVLRWMAARRLTVVSREEVRREALARRTNADETQSLLERLVRAGWVRPHMETRQGAGRPASRWEVNPRLRKAQS